MFSLADLEDKQSHKVLYLSFPWAHSNHYMRICLFIRIINEWFFSFVSDSHVRFTAFSKKGLKRLKTSKFPALCFLLICMNFGRQNFHCLKSEGEIVKKILKTTKTPDISSRWKAANWAPYLERKIWECDILRIYHHLRISYLLIKPIGSLLENEESELSLHLQNNPLNKHSSRCSRTPTERKRHLLIMEACGTGQPQWIGINWEGKLFNFREDMELLSGLTQVVSDDEWLWRWQSFIGMK